MALKEEHLNDVSEMKDEMAEMAQMLEKQKQAEMARARQDVKQNSKARRDCIQLRTMLTEAQEQAETQTARADDCEMLAQKIQMRSQDSRQLSGCLRLYFGLHMSEPLRT